MDRRKFIGTLAGGMLAAPVALEAQQARRMYRIGYLSPGQAFTGPDLDAFRRGLSELGWIERRNIEIISRWSGPTNDRLPELAAELVALGVDVIVTISTPGALAAQRATSSIPIVMTGSSDPVGRGLVASLARPGGNITGLTNNPGAGFFAKKLQLLKEVAPKVSRVALLWNPTNLGEVGLFDELQAVAPGLGLTMLNTEAREPENVATALSTALRGRADGLYATNSALNISKLRVIVDFAKANGLPSMFEDRRFVSAGGLMSYSTDWLELRRRSASYVDNILRGAKPGELAIEQPQKYELVVNRSTAKALGLAIPQSILSTAVIE
ncbi:MAG TPA: ABC transporter substrate-binding protein [Casimicrobiaceae bacterium]|jgi:putative ABC transport system substrate-binding protein